MGRPGERSARIIGTKRKEVVDVFVCKWQCIHAVTSLKPVDIYIAVCVPCLLAARCAPVSICFVVHSCVGIASLG